MRCGISTKRRVRRGETFSRRDLTGGRVARNVFPSFDAFRQTSFVQKFLFQEAYQPTDRRQGEDVDAAFTREVANQHPDGKN